MAIKVHLRQKKISKGQKSLYLDFSQHIKRKEPFYSKQKNKWIDTTRREFLGIYILEKPKNPLEKQANKQALQLAEQIRQKRDNEINKPEIYSEYEKEQLRIKDLGEKCFVEYFKELADKRKSSTHDNWISAYKYLYAFTNGHLKFADLNEKFLEDFKEYLLTTKSNKSKKTKLSQNSAASYFNKIKATLKQAFKEGILQVNLNDKVEAIKEKETRREFVTLEELNTLVKTPCNDILYKRAALFSALTGMAFKEIQNMVWSDISYIKEIGYTVLSKRQKTQRDNYLPISGQAYSFLQGNANPKEMPQDNKVFEGLKYSALKNRHLHKWINDAGITKNITFHSFRHTYATLQLANKTDITTVQKLLGHKHLRTTMIYAKVLDESKREAANKIKLDL